MLQYFTVYFAILVPPGSISLKFEILLPCVLEDPFYIHPRLVSRQKRKVVHASMSGKATRRNCAAPIKAAPAPKFMTHLRASIMLNLLSIANSSARRPPALPPFPLPSPAINLVMASLPLIILVCLILILPTLHACPLLQHPWTRQHHRPLSHPGRVSRPRLPLVCHDRLRQEEKRCTR